MQMNIESMLFILIFAYVKSSYSISNGQNCQCVSIFLCADETDFDHEKIDTRSKRQIIERKKHDCDSALEICCEPERIITETIQKSVEGCGIRNFDGIDSKLITKGNEAKFGEFPWTIAVLHNTPDKQDEYICDGSLIHQKVVMTAAHCIHGKTASKIKVRAGEWDTQTTNESLPHQDRAVEDILMHENYNYTTFHNDIALLILSHSVEITKHVNIICLPESIDEIEHAQCVLSSWGRNKWDNSYEEILIKLDFKIVPHPICEKQLKQTKLDRFVLDQSFICANDMLGNERCKGDGGSPLICPLKIDNRRFVQVGVASQSMGCLDGTPDIFANVLHFRTWIDEKLLFYNFDNSVYQYEQYIEETSSFL